jgi:hypothetical protein
MSPSVDTSFTFDSDFLMTSIFRAAYGAKTDAGQDIQARLEEPVRVLKFPERFDLLAGTLLKS